MSNETAVVRVSQEMLDSAKQHAALYSRSASGQIEHWARLGRAVEESPTFSTRQIGRMLSATFTSEDLVKMTHPHQPVIDLEVAIEKLGWKVSLALEPYWQEMDKPEGERNQEVIAQAIEEVKRLRKLQDQLKVSDVEQIQSILAEQINGQGFPDK